MSDLPHYEDIFTKKIGTWKQAGEIAKYVSNLLEELVDVNGMLRDSNPATVGMANVLALYQKITEEENLIDFSSIQTEAYDNRFLAVHIRMFDPQYWRRALRLVGRLTICDWQKQRDMHV